jgi:hypothetical protein
VVERDHSGGGKQMVLEGFGHHAEKRYPIGHDESAPRTSFCLEGKQHV